MLMSSTEQPFDRFVGTTYPELCGRRVLITGVTEDLGIDIARAFAEHGARLVVQVYADPLASAALGEMLAQTAADLTMIECPLTNADDIVGFARRAVAVYGGLDAVVNVLELSLGQIADDDLDAIEARISEVLMAPCLVARVAANRMRLLQTDGLILHVASLPRHANARERAFAAAAKATLTAMTRDDARAWARDGIRVNAVAPETGGFCGRGLASEADIAALALFLAAGRGRPLTGHVLEAEAA